MELHKHLDIYCERVGEGFLAEPWNLFSNGFFVLAGVLMILRASQTVSPLGVRGYGALSILVGLCSFSFHGWATLGTMLLDVLSIIFCVFFAMGLYSHKILKFPWWKTLMMYGFLLGSTYLARLFLGFEFVNGSEEYFGVWLTLLLLAAFDGEARGRKVMLGALGLFTLSLIFRSLDHPEGALCASFPLGVHYLWHMFNAGVLYQVFRRFLKQATG